MIFLKPAELRHTLKISKSTESRFLKHGMPHINSGRLRRYDETAVVEWFRNYQPNTTSNVLPPGDYKCRECHFEATISEPFEATRLGPCPRCGSRERPIRVDVPAV